MQNPSPPDAPACGGCGRPLSREAALCTACGWRRDGQAVKTRVLDDEAADRGPKPAETAAVRGSQNREEDDAETRGPAAWIGWVIATLVAVFALLLLLWSFSGPGGLGGASAPARAVRVLPVFDAGGRLLVLHRDEVAAAGAGAAVVVELDTGDRTDRPELVPAAGGDAAPGVAIEAAGADPLGVDLEPLAAGGPPNLLPVRPPDRFIERPSPGDPARLQATATYERGGFEGRLRLAAGGAKPVDASGVLTAENADAADLSGTLSWNGTTLTVEPGTGVESSWASAGTAEAGGPVAWLFVLPEGAPPAVGAYEVRIGGEILGRVELPDVAAAPAAANASPPVVGGGKRPGVILPSPVKRANGTAPPPPINTNNPLSYFDVLSGAKANARGLTSANALRQMATGFLLYEQMHGDFPETLDDLSGVLGPMNALLNNQRTGDNPGFLYEKPAGGGVQPIVWETIGGVKDPSGAVLMSDGTIQ